MSAATVRTVGRAGAVARASAPARSGSARAAGTSRATTRPTGSRAASSRPAEGLRRTAVLRLVPQAPSRVARAPFIGVVVGLLALGLLGLLALNTSLAESSFALHALQGQAKVLDDQEQVLRQEVEALQAPEALAGRAEALGMVPGGPPAFLRLSDGKVLGKPSPAPAGTALGSLPAVDAPAAQAPVPAVDVPAVATTPAPERLLSRAPVESAGPTAGTTDDRSAADGAATDGATDDGATDDGRDATPDGGRTTVRRTTAPPTPGRRDDGARSTDDGATDAAASTSTTTGARR